MAAIEQLVRISGTCATVFRALTVNEEVAGWFVGTECDAWEVGHEVRWFSGGVRSQISAIEPDKVLALTVTQGSDWDGTEIVFALEQVADRVVLRFDHRGWLEVDDHFRDCAFNWAYFLQSLKLYVETGVGTPEA